MFTQRFQFLFRGYYTTHYQQGICYCAEVLLVLIKEMHACFVPGSVKVEITCSLLVIFLIKGWLSTCGWEL